MGIFYSKMSSLAVLSSQITISSLELVNIINSNRKAANDLVCRHDNFMAKVPSVIGEIDALKFKGVYRGGNGQDRPCYNFPKREACLMAMSYSYELQAKVFDRMTELENAAAPKKQLSTIEMFEIGLAALKENESLKLKIEEQAPAVRFVEEYVDSSGLKRLRDVAKIVKIPERKFVIRLIEDGFLYRPSPKELMPIARYLHSGYFAVKTDTKNGHAYAHMKFTPKGVAWIGKLYAPVKDEFAMEFCE